jgi:hypothetical protein
LYAGALSIEPGIVAEPEPETGAETEAETEEEDF